MDQEPEDVFRPSRLCAPDRFAATEDPREAPGASSAA